MIFSIFLIVLVAAFAALVFFTEPSKTDKLIHSRLASLDRKSAFIELDDAGIVKEITFSTIPGLDRFLRQNRFANGLQLLIEQANVDWTVGRFVFISLTAIFFGAALGNWWISAGLVGWTPGVVLGAAPYVFLLQKRNMRFRRFTSLLPAAIDLMSRSLRAGQSLPAALELVAQEVEDPVGSEFRRATDEQNFGLPFRESMLNLSRRVPVADLQFLITAILVQKETGGNLAILLDKTSNVIRERVRVEGQLRIRSAQGRITGWILCALPFAMYFVMNIVSPGYGKILFEDPRGQKWVAYAAVLMVLGIFSIRRIVSVKF
ncbi:MAG TPA: type II secretion system F family protein [Terriglobales bacterium]